ncbi:uncharacterized protein [Nerophis lumbriciformis]|uniref:uncharacterized protein isoform X3 n=1 Tax=Nerophis lumbriciformis TaxID=546530 RepID=UPI003BABE952
MCERTIAEYEEELCPTKEEKARQQDAVFKKHQVVLHRTDAQQRPHIKEEEEEPQPPHTKEEEEEVWITQEEECLLGQEEADLTKFRLTVVSVKTEDHEDKPPESSQLHHSPNVCEEHLPEQQGWSFKMEQEEPGPSYIKKEEETTQPPYIKEEEETTQPPYIKEEEEEHIIGQEFPVIDVIVKSDDDEVKGESEEKREVSKGKKTRHTDNTRFKCSHCDKTFKFRCNLITHVRQHTGEKPFICSVCGASFSTKCNWDKHVQLHTAERDFICFLCGKGFKQRHNLKTHMRIHTGEKVLSCSVCGERFSYKYQCKKHKCAGENSRRKGGNVAQMVVWPCQPTQSCWFLTSVRNPSPGCSVLVPSAPTLYAAARPLVLSVSGVNSYSCG